MAPLVGGDLRIWSSFGNMYRRHRLSSDSGVVIFSDWKTNLSGAHTVPAKPLIDGSTILPYEETACVPTASTGSIDPNMIV